jgi:hypothetical protein
MMNALPETIDESRADLVRIKEVIGMPDDIEEEEDEEVLKLILTDETLDESEHPLSGKELDEDSSEEDFTA